MTAGNLVEKRFQDLRDALMKLRDLRGLICSADLPPGDVQRLAEELRHTVIEVRSLQRQLLNADLTADRQRQICELLAGKNQTGERA
jgi:hypothetical protein